MKRRDLLRKACSAPLASVAKADPKIVYRVLNIIVEASLPETEAFSRVVPIALREYADAVNRGESGNHDVEKFEASNGCSVKVIHGHMTS